MFRSRPRIAGVLAAAVSIGLLVGCSSGSATPTATGSATPTQSKTLTVISHDAFVLPKATLAKFASETGYDVKYLAPGDAGTVVNQLVLSKDSPLADVVYGIDNTFAGRAIDAGVLTGYASASVPASAKSLLADDKNLLTPIDYGDVCINADTAWFRAKGLAVPKTFDDLTKPAYANLLVVSNPATSSPGLAMLAATVAAKGADGYLDYWKALKANGVKVVAGWTEAYTVEFSGSSGKGSRPLVLSYSSSPAYEPKTEALTSTCFRQVEYAGVIAGAQNEVGARKFIDFLLSDEVQAEIPGQMYMYPANSAIALPSDWAKYAAVVTNPYTLPAAELSADRDAWVKAWTAAVIG